MASTWYCSFPCRSCLTNINTACCTIGEQDRLRYHSWQFHLRLSVDCLLDTHTEGLPHLHLDLCCFLVPQMCCCGIRQLGSSGLQLSLQLLCVFSCLQLLPAGKTCSMPETHGFLSCLGP